MVWLQQAAVVLPGQHHFRQRIQALQGAGHEEGRQRRLGWVRCALCGRQMVGDGGCRIVQYSNTQSRIQHPGPGWQCWPSTVQFEVRCSWVGGSFKTDSHTAALPSTAVLRWRTCHHRLPPHPGARCNAVGWPGNALLFKTAGIMCDAAVPPAGASEACEQPPTG